MAGVYYHLGDFWEVRLDEKVRLISEGPLLVRLQKAIPHLDDWAKEHGNKWPSLIDLRYPAQMALHK